MSGVRSDFYFAMLEFLFSKTAIFPLVTFLLVTVFIPFAARLATSIGFVDRPGGRKSHEGNIPPVGGVVIFPVFMLMAAFYGLNWSIYLWFYVALCLLLALGFLDDRYNVNAWAKFGIQILAALLIVIPGQATIYGLGNIFGFGDFWLGLMAVPFSFLAVMLLVNGVNLMDGLDGLAAGKGFIALFWLIVGAALAGADDFMALILIMAAALAGFLVYNLRHPLRKKASIFLGDAGSLALGLSLAWFCLHAAMPAGGKSLSPMAVAWILALPIFDTCGQFARRIIQGRHPFDADRHHFHHHFIYAGFRVELATFSILIIGFVFGGIGVLGDETGVSEPVLAYSWMALLIWHVYMSLRPHRFRRMISRMKGMSGKRRDDE